MQIIPCIYLTESPELYVNNKNVVGFSNSIEHIERLVSEGMNELIVMLISSTEEKRKTYLKYLAQINSKFPNLKITAGGGLHNRAEVKDFVKSGVSGLLLNTIAVKNPDLINYISGEYGSDFVSINIDTKKSFNSWKVYISGGKSRTEMDAVNWSKLLEFRGASRLFISSASRSNQHEIYELFPLLKEVVTIPVFAVIHSAQKEDFLFSIQNAPVEGLISTSYFLQNEKPISTLREYLSENNFQIS